MGLEGTKQASYRPEVEASNKILTIPNVISFARLCLVPVYFVLLLKGYDIYAALVFAVAAGTDFVDGQIARRTNSVSKLGQLLDPAVDRILMITGVIGLCLVDRVPLWTVLLIIARDLYLLYGGTVLTFKYHTRVPVVFAGKVATTLLFIGFALLLVNVPQVAGLGLAELTWLPGFGSQPWSIGIWFVYAGLFISIFTTAHYIYSAKALVNGIKASREA
ncbi:MAG: CDP-alcohol phosphatidyltransferase family protein [Eggerthellaceae bacterium]|nr:CDP-alcohol phosphatidyltransferase family protein [Eggerthellaceae bacterium]